MKILVMNAGSSSQKSCLYEIPETNCPIVALPPLWEAQIDWAATDQVAAQLQVKTLSGSNYHVNLPDSDRATVVQKMLQTLWTGETKVIDAPSEINIVGHRVVHGGTYFQQPVQIDATVKSTIAQLAPIAPNHNTANLEGIEIIETLLGQQVPQFAVFDTAFHSQMPTAAKAYAGPYNWLEQGIQRYGFHGTSHAYCADRAAQLLNRDLADLQLITCHLGNGCSLAAIRNGQSVDTTMGFTPLDGLMMGTRSGSVDPGILLYLMREQNYDEAKLDRLLNKESGLKGLSGISHDIRQIQVAIASGNPQAQIAWNVYIHRIRSGIGAMLMSLNRLDALIFTAGVGEHSADVRSQICRDLDFLGLKLDEVRNHDVTQDCVIQDCVIQDCVTQDRDISAQNSSVRVLVLQTQEAWQIAKICWSMPRVANKYGR